MDMMQVSKYQILSLNEVTYGQQNSTPIQWQRYFKVIKAIIQQFVERLLYLTIIDGATVLSEWGN